jgi:hypothetical protein
VHEDDFETIAELVNGKPRKSKWRSIEMKVIRLDAGRHLRHSDSPWFGSDALMFRPKAVAALIDLLEESGELLPLQCADAVLSVFNPRALVGALDSERASIERFSSGSIMAVNRYEFVPQIIADVAAFKIAELRVSPTFVTQRFVDRWADCRLSGLEFRQVWPAPR